MFDDHKSDARLSKHGGYLAHPVDVGQKLPNQTQSLLKASISEALSWKGSCKVPCAAKPSDLCRRDLAIRGLLACCVWPHRRFFIELGNTQKGADALLKLVYVWRRFDPLPSEQVLHGHF